MKKGFNLAVGATMLITGGATSAQAAETAEKHHPFLSYRVNDQGVRQNHDIPEIVRSANAERKLPQLRAEFNKAGIDWVDTASLDDIIRILNERLEGVSCPAYVKAKGLNELKGVYRYTRNGNRVDSYDRPCYNGTVDEIVYVMRDTMKGNLAGMQGVLESTSANFLDLEKQQRAEAPTRQGSGKLSPDAGKPTKSIVCPGGEKWSEEYDDKGVYIGTTPDFSRRRLGLIAPNVTINPSTGTREGKIDPPCERVLY